MAKTIVLSMLMRLSLDAVLGQQRGKGEDVLIPHDIRQKLEVTDELRDEYIKRFGNQVVVDEKAMQAAAPITLELEKAEVRYLQRLLKEWANFGEGDVVWFVPLRKGLDSADE